MLTFQANLYEMLGGKLIPASTGVTIEAPTPADAVRRAKDWSSSVAVGEGSYLQVLQDGHVVSCLKPGEF